MSQTACAAGKHRTNIRRVSDRSQNGFLCKACGAPLPAASEEEFAECASCKPVQPASRGFRVGQEVMVPSFHGYAPAHVSAVGEQLTVQLQADPTTEQSFQPYGVVPVTADLSAVVPGQRVYVQDFIGWKLGRIVATKLPATVIVVLDGWEDAIFQKHLAPSAVRAILPLAVQPEANVPRVLHFRQLNGPLSDRPVLVMMLGCGLMLAVFIVLAYLGME